MPSAVPVDRLGSGLTSQPRRESNAGRAFSTMTTPALSSTWLGDASSPGGEGSQAVVVTAAVTAKTTMRPVVPTDINFMGSYVNRAGGPPAAFSNKES